MQSLTQKTKGPDSTRSLGPISTLFFSYIEKYQPEPYGPRPFLVIAVRSAGLTLAHFFEECERVKPHFVVPPFKLHDAQFTSAAAERVKAQMPKHLDTVTGVVAVGRDRGEQVEFLFWAAQQGYRPIVILPDRKYPCDWQLNQFCSHFALAPHAWYHLAGGYDYTFDPTKYPGTWSWGVSLDDTENREEQGWLVQKRAPNSSKD